MRCSSSDASRRSSSVSTVEEWAASPPALRGLAKAEESTRRFLQRKADEAAHPTPKERPFTGALNAQWSGRGVAHELGTRAYYYQMMESRTIGTGHGWPPG